jgi:thiol-disulfide isomerase/thioredoxin
MSRRLCLLAALSLAVSLVAPGAYAEPAVSGMRGFDAASLDAIRKTNAGKPFVLAFWSIHCAPCIEDMGDWRALKQKYPDLPIVLVTTDPPTQHAAAARMLAKYRAGPVETWGFTDEFGERVRFAVDRAWRGELPRTYFYDAAHHPQVRSGRIDLSWTEAWFAQQKAAARK